MTRSPVSRHRSQVGAISAEYAVTTCGAIGFGGVLIKLLTSDFGQELLKTILTTFLRMVGIG